MLDVLKERERWITCADLETRNEIESIADSAVIHDSFYRNLEFGTGGLRGVLGVGPNRMNTYVIRKATQGLSNFLNKRYEDPSVAIARDSRNGGAEFCTAAAEVLAANGIHVYLYPRIEPTPALSYAVRYLSCSAGICITASHNPSKYNGYKVYDSAGCQITTDFARSIQSEIDSVDIFEDIKTTQFEEAEKDGLITWIDDVVIESYVSSCFDVSQGVDCSDLRLVYTPLNGTGLECIQGVFDRLAVKDVFVVPEQAMPDGNFPTCPYPNPEVPESLSLGLKLAADNNTDLLLASDPDADRLGVAVVRQGETRLLSGNEVGILLCDYICNMQVQRGGNPSDLIVITTIVSSAMVDALCKNWGFELRRTLTGFKYIGEQINLLEQNGESRRFGLGFEESCGYLVGTSVRDKDAVVATMALCEMAAWYRSRGMDLKDAIDLLYEKYGFYCNKLLSVEHPGQSGMNRIKSIMDGIRSNPIDRIAGFKVENIVDYSNGADMPIMNKNSTTPGGMLPPANVIELQLEGENKLMLRPSGTEPKIKVYAFSKGPTMESAETNLEAIANEAMRIIS